MSGIKLREMEVNDMLDVLHYLFEEDVNFINVEQLDSRNVMRKTLYKRVYNKTYSYGQSTSVSNDSTSYSDMSFDDNNSAMSSHSEQIKPYTPPTNFNPDAENPFSGILREAPLGG